MYGVFEEGTLISALFGEERDAEDAVSPLRLLPEYRDASLYVDEVCPMHEDHHQGYCFERPDWYKGSTVKLLRRVRDGLRRSLQEDLKAS